MKTKMILLIISFIFLGVSIFYLIMGLSVSFSMGLAFGFLFSSLVLNNKEKKK